MKTYWRACAVAAMLTVAGNAEAATSLTTIEQYWTLADPATSSVRMFDGALGTLEKVELSFTVSGIGTTTVTNTLNSPIGVGVDVGYRFFAPSSTFAAGTEALKIGGACFAGMVAGGSTVTQGCTYANSIKTSVAPNPSAFVGKVGDVFIWKRDGNTTSIAKEIAAMTLIYSYSTAVSAPPVASAVPEPTTWALMAGGFMMVGATVRRRRRHAPVAA